MLLCIEPDQEMDDLTFEMSHAVGKVSTSKISHSDLLSPTNTHTQHQEGESQDRGSPVIIDLTEVSESLLILKSLNEHILMHVCTTLTDLNAT